MKHKTITAMVADLNPDRPVVCLRPAELEAAAQELVSMFPGDVLYAVKCNPLPGVLRALYRGGVRHFDTASLNEVELIRAMFGRKSTPYFNHPVKARSAIADAHEKHGVRHYVIDTEAELDKIEQVVGTDAIISVRLATAPGIALQHMSSKFGATPAEGARLVRMAANRGFSVGVAFHVGSQCKDPDDYYRAIKLAAHVRDASGTDLDILNVGGGFPAPYIGDDIPPLEDYVATVVRGVEDYDFQGAKLQCEPGRALAVDGCSILTQVHLRKDRTLYVNDGIFGTLGELVYLKLRVKLRAHRKGGQPIPGPMGDFTLYGPTCDPVDVMPGVWQLPEGIQEGDWVEIGQIGAYSAAITTTFNGFSTDTVVEVDEPAYWNESEQPVRIRATA
ncbi:MAG: type III PLP-dependent enzyme [Alphaproteobacteria bacterium]|nr:type III PLP-dependent enzyme [Alphaproteobacteria bacterium]